MADKEKVDALRAALVDKSRVVKRVLATDDGARLMEILRKEFFTRLEAKDEHQIIFNAGRADVVAYLMQLDKLED